MSEVSTILFENVLCGKHASGRSRDRAHVTIRKKGLKDVLELNVQIAYLPFLGESPAPLKCFTKAFDAFAVFHRGDGEYLIACPKNVEDYV